MTDSIADDILRNGFDRWKRLEEEKAAIGEDLKQLFAELKGQGFDSKALRAAFRHVVKIDDLANQEHEAVVDLYVESLTRNARVRAREIIEEFPAETVNPETGEITEREDHSPDAGNMVPEITEPQSVPSAAQGSDGAPLVASQPNQPETANQSLGDGDTAIRTDNAVDGAVNGAVLLPTPQRAGMERGIDQSVTAGETAPLPEVPADFITDQTPDQLAARMRRTLQVRPLCQRSYSCGRMADQSECAQCLKAAQEMVA